MRQSNALQPKIPAVQLKDIPLFKGLTSENLELISRFVMEKRFTKGEMLNFEGDSCKNIFILRYGRVKIFRMSASGREQILQILEPGDTCACNPGSEHWTCSSSSQAMTDGVSWILARERYSHLIVNNSVISQTLNRLFAERLCRFCHLIEEVSLDSTQSRLIKFLLDMQANGVAVRDKGNVISLPFTREEIAQRLGTTRETVTRYLYKLKRKRLIDIHPKQVTICNADGLKKLLN